MMARGVTIIEAVVCVFVTAVAMSASLAVIGTVGKGQALMAQRLDGMALAEELMSEVLAMPFKGDDEPVVSLETGAPRAGAALPLNRAAFNDLDDYAGWLATPPQEKDGTPMAEHTGLSRQVSMWWINADGTRASSDTGRLRVRVAVSRSGRVLASVETIRTRARDRFDGLAVVEAGPAPAGDPDGAADATGGDIAGGSGGGSGGSGGSGIVGGLVDTTLSLLGGRG